VAQPSGWNSTPGAGARGGLFQCRRGGLGTDFSASAPSLKDLSAASPRAVPAPMGGSVYQEWRLNHPQRRANLRPQMPSCPRKKSASGNLGSGSDFRRSCSMSAFPSTDIGPTDLTRVPLHLSTTSPGSPRTADPHFLYLRRWRRCLGLGSPDDMADADVLHRLRDLCQGNIRIYRLGEKEGSRRRCSARRFCPADEACRSHGPMRPARSRHLKFGASGDLVH